MKVFCHSTLVCSALLVGIATASLSFTQPTWSTLLAQEDEDPDAEARERVEVARPLMEKGSYGDARRQLQRAVKADPTNVDAALLLAEAYRQTGKLRKAIGALATFDADSGVLALRGELLLDTGDDVGARAALDAALVADEDNLVARRLLGRLLEETGKREEAVDIYIDVNSRWAKSEGRDSDDTLLAVARARLGIFRLSDEFRPSINSVLSRLEPVVKRSPERVDVMVELGNLYLAAHKDVFAKQWFDRAVDRNPHYAPAIFGVALQKAFRYDTESRKEAERALRENGEFVPALLFLGALDLGDGRYDPAQEHVEKAIAVNPVRAESRAARAALHYLRGEQAEFDAEVQAILARDRHGAVAYLVVARALEVDDRNWEAHFLVGRNAMNIGDDEKAEAHLKAAEDGDPFANIYRANFLEVFRRLQRFPVRDDEDFVVKLPLVEDEAYYPLLRSALAKSLAVLEERWDFEQPRPIFLSVFDQQNDFAARTIGLPGFPALGACFGRVVTLDSPRALPPGAFSWRATLHHELAHVITLELSKGRVPRWLTEGLSVYEERKVSPQWNRESERDLIDAIASDEVLTLANINAAFRGPRVLYAYYQGGLMCEFIERDFGFPALREMVRLFGDGSTTPEVVAEALEISPAEFDERFLRYAREYVADLAVLARPSRKKMRRLKLRLRKDKDDIDGIMLLASGQIARGDAQSALSSLSKAGKVAPGDPRIALIRGLVARAEGRPDMAVRFATEAIENGADIFEARMLLATAAADAKHFDEAKVHLRRAIELFPVVTGPNSPRLSLAKLLMGEGEERLAEAMALLRDHADVAEDDFGTRMRLARYYEEHEEAAAELATLLELRDITPLPNRGFGRGDALAIHVRLGDLQLAAGLHEDAELSRRLAVGVARMETGDKNDPPFEGAELAALLVDHAEALRLVGRTDDALYRIDEALRVDETNAAARELRDRLRPE